jgi:crotonobetainyl-CoA:carnitine CoA-transferase CaiB-like acyl-CoA transferase
MLTSKPLAGITVLEIGHSIAAPYTGMIMAELGADVIKVENPKTGDYARGWGPPFVGGAASAFQAVNRNKRGITVDLTQPQERDRLKQLIDRDVDVVVHNLKFGAMEKLGLAAADLLKNKPQLLVCNVGAYGQTGPMRDKPGYDPLMQAFGGLMSTLGEEDRPPVRVAVSIVDMGTGMWAAIGILAALQERNRTGKGGVVDTSLCETSLAWMTVPIAAYLSSGQVQKKTGSANAQIVPYQAFEASNGYIMVAAGNDNLFARLVAALEQPALSSDPRFLSNADRVVNRDALIKILAPLFKCASVQEWNTRLDEVGVPSGPIHDVDQVVAHPQTKALGMIQASPDNEFSVTGLPLSFNGQRPAFDNKAPALGEHNDEIFGSLGSVN